MRERERPRQATNPGRPDAEEHGERLQQFRQIGRQRLGAARARDRARFMESNRQESGQ